MPMQFTVDQWFFSIVAAACAGFVLGYWRGGRFVLRKMRELKKRGF